MHMNGILRTCLPLVTERLHICLSRDMDVCITTAFQSDGTRRADAIYTCMCENKIQDPPFPFFIYSLCHICEGKTGQTDERVHRFIFFSDCQVDASRLSSRLSLAVVSAVLNKKLVNASLLIFWRSLFFKPFSRSGLLVRDRGPWWFLISCSYVHTVCGAARLHCKTGR